MIFKVLSVHLTREDRTGQVKPASTDSDAEGLGCCEEMTYIRPLH